MDYQADSDIEILISDEASATEATNTPIQIDIDDEEEDEVLQSQTEISSWFCALCNCEIIQEHLNQHFVCHTLFMHPIPKEISKGESDLDSNKNTLIFDEIAGKLGSILKKFSNRTTNDGFNSVVLEDEKTNKNDSYLEGSLMNLDINSEEVGNLKEAQESIASEKSLSIVNNSPNRSTFSSHNSITDSSPGPNIFKATARKSTSGHPNSPNVNNNKLQEENNSNNNNQITVESPSASSFLSSLSEAQQIAEDREVVEKMENVSVHDDVFYDALPFSSVFPAPSSPLVDEAHDENKGDISICNSIFGNVDDISDNSEHSPLSPVVSKERREKESKKHKGKESSSEKRRDKEDKAHKVNDHSKSVDTHHSSKKHSHHHRHEEKEKAKEHKKHSKHTEESTPSDKSLALKKVFKKSTKQSSSSHSRKKEDNFINDSDSDSEMKTKKKLDKLKLKIKLSDPNSPSISHGGSSKTSKTGEKRKHTDDETSKPKKLKEKHSSKLELDQNTKEEEGIVKKEKDKSSTSASKSRQYIINLKNKYKSPMIQVHIESMMNEMNKENPSLAKLNELMDSTFKYRQFELGQYADPIQNSLRDFPALKKWQIIKSEFDRIKKAENVTLGKLENKLKDRLIKYHTKFQVNNYISPDRLLQKAIDDAKKNEHDKDLLRDVQMLCLAFQQATWELNGKLFKQRNKGDPRFAELTPSIDILGDLSSSSKKIIIYCERKEIARVPNMYEAILCCYSIYYIYNLCYESTAQSLFEYFDKLLGA